MSLLTKKICAKYVNMQIIADIEENFEANLLCQTTPVIFENDPSVGTEKKALCLGT